MTLLKACLHLHHHPVKATAEQHRGENSKGKWSKSSYRVYKGKLSGLMNLCACFSPLYSAKHTRCAAFGIQSCFYKVIGYSRLQYPLFRNRSERLFIYFIIGNGTDNPSHMLGFL